MKENKNNEINVINNSINQKMLTEIKFYKNALMILRIYR